MSAHRNRHGAQQMARFSVVILDETASILRKWAHICCKMIWFTAGRDSTTATRRAVASSNAVGDIVSADLLATANSAAIAIASSYAAPEGISGSDSSLWTQRVAVNLQKWERKIAAAAVHRNLDAKSCP